MQTPVGNQENRRGLLDFLRTLNLFESESNDVKQIHRERLSTRLYLILLFTFTISLVIYASVLARTITVTITRPDENDFKQSFEHFSETLDCPCSRISIPYDEFVRSQVTYHEVCQSQFISQEWISAIYSANVSFIPPNDIRTTISAFWQLVRSFCILSKNTVMDAYMEFNGTLLLSPVVQGEILIATKIEASWNFSLTSALSNLKRNLLISRGSTMGNGLFSGLATSYYFRFTSDSSIADEPFLDLGVNVFEDGCSCSSFNGCPQPAVFFSPNGTSNWTTLPGMIYDCLPLDATLASSLQCFYDTWCLSLIQHAATTQIISQPLNMSSRFARNVSLQILLDELMIEEFSATVMFSSYYTQCDPIYCTYSYTHKYDVLFIITLVFSAFGGVSIVLRLLAPLTIKLVLTIHAWKKRQRSVSTNDDAEQLTNQHRTLKIRLRSLVERFQKLLLHLNLFKNSSWNIDVVHRQRIVTRVFLVCLVISLTITSLYTFLSTQIKTISIPKPSREDYERLMELHSDSLQCSCAQLSIPYSSIIEIVPTFHQVCSSGITSSAWYNRLGQFNKSLVADLQQFEIALGANYFQVLDMFCALARNTIADDYRVFSANTLVNNYLLSETIFSKQMESLTDGFIISTHNKFTGILSLSRNTTQISQLASRTLSNFQISRDENNQVSIAENLLGFTNYGTTFLSVCSCIAQGNKCAIDTCVYNSTDSDELIYLSNLKMKCLPTESVLASTLECWYDPHCFSNVLAAYRRDGVSNINDTCLLDANIASRFPHNTTMEMMMNELLLENYTVIVSYDKFYDKCAPVSCVYTVEQQFDWFYVIVVIIGIYGGLSQSLRLILPVIVRLMLMFLQYIRMRDATVDQAASISEHPQCNIAANPRMTKIRQYISRYNLFETSSSTVHTLRREIWSTRFYLFLLIATTLTLVLYTGLVERSRTKTLVRPSQSTYEQLHSRYSNTLQCPCSNISLPYNSFTVHLNATFHPICSSVFVSEEWFTYFRLYSSGTSWWLHIRDFRKWGNLYFQLLQSFCSLANATVNNSIEQFQNSSFITPKIISSVQFQIQVNYTLQSLQLSISTFFARSLQLFRASDQGNALLSLLGTNWQPVIENYTSDSSLLSIPITYNNGTCSCATSSACLEPAAFYNLSLTKIYIVDGIFLGCLCLESILSSSLSCFFSNSCVSEFTNAMSRGIPGQYWTTKKPHLSLLPVLLPNSQFKVNDTIETIVNQLFVDIWFSEISYERYYNACAPSHCSYTYRIRFDVLYILTTFLSVFNGLSIGLHFAVRYTIKLIHRIRNCFRT